MISYTDAKVRLLMQNLINLIMLLLLQGGQQIFKSEFQAFPGLFELKTFIFQDKICFFPGLIQAVKDFLHA